jgi:hypothetical protein
MSKLMEIFTPGGRRLLIAGKFKAENGETGFVGYASFFSLEYENIGWMDVWNERGEHCNNPEFNFLPEGIFEAFE